MQHLLQIALFINKSALMQFNNPQRNKMIVTLTAIDRSSVTLHVFCFFMILMYFVIQSC